MKTVGLVLGSGGARGWAHIGAIRALEDANIRIHSVTGASVGALVGAFYVAGELDELEEFVRELDWKSLVTYFDLVFPSSGLLDGDRVYDLLSDHLKGFAIESAEINFCCIATDLVSGDEVRLKTGLIVDAIRASISLPGIFTPFQKDDQWWGDGGVANPLPIDVMREMDVDVTVAVNLNSHSGSSALGAEKTEMLSPNSSLVPQDSGQPSSEAVSDEGSASKSAHRQSHQSRNSDSKTDSQGNSQQSSQSQSKGHIEAFFQQVEQRSERLLDRFQDKIEKWLPEKKKGLNIFEVIGTSLNVMEQLITQNNLRSCPPDILIEPPLGRYSIFDFHQADAMIEEGYRCMEELIPELQEKLAEESSDGATSNSDAQVAGR